MCPVAHPPSPPLELAACVGRPGAWRGFTSPCLHTPPTTDETLYTRNAQRVRLRGPESRADALYEMTYPKIYNGVFSLWQQRGNAQA